MGSIRCWVQSPPDRRKTPGRKRSLDRRSPSWCAGPLNGLGTFRRRSAPPSTPFTAAPSPSGLALPAALLHAAHPVKTQRTATLRESLQLPHKCKLSSVWSSATGKRGFGSPFLFCGRGAAAAAAAFLSRVRLGAASTGGWREDGRMLGRGRKKKGWGSADTSLAPAPLTPARIPDGLCVSVRGEGGSCWTSRSRRGRAAPRDARAEHLRGGSQATGGGRKC